GFDPRHHTGGAAPRHRHPARERYAPLAAETVCESASGGAAQGRLEDGAELALFALRVDGAPMRTPPLPSRLSSLPEPAVPPEAACRVAQRFMFHCYNLEHEDGMMMRNFSVI